MFRRAVFLPVLFILLYLPAFARADTGSRISPDEVRPGMQGYGLTVLQGTRPERFSVEAMGVLKKVVGGADIVLIRITDPRVREVAEGMSGSPIYLNDRLLGALAYSWQFGKEPIAGVTPIGNMMVGVHGPSASPASLSVEPTGEGTASLRPIGTRLLAGGFNRRSLPLLDKSLSSFGCLSVAGGAASAEKDEAELQPGSAIGVQLVAGDFDISAVGTVTTVEDGVITAFGHPLLQAGRVSLPLTGAYVHGIYPSLLSSFKLASPTSVRGSIDLDGAWGISGRLGGKADMIPVHLAVRDRLNDADRSYDYQVANLPGLAELLVQITVADAMAALGDGTGTVNRLTLSVRGEGLPEMKRSNVWIGGGDPLLPGYVMSDLAEALRYLSLNPFGKRDLKGLDMLVEVSKGEPLARITGLQTDRLEASPGETIRLSVALEARAGGRLQRAFDFRIPDNAPGGMIRLAVHGGVDNDAARGMLGIPREEPLSLEEMVGYYNDGLPNDCLILSAALSGSGIRARGRLIPDLPPSIVASVRMLQNGDITPAATPYQEVRHEELVIVGGAVAVIRVRSPLGPSSGMPPGGVPGGGEEGDQGGDEEGEDDGKGRGDESLELAAGALFGGEGADRAALWRRDSTRAMLPSAQPAPVQVIMASPGGPGAARPVYPGAVPGAAVPGGGMAPANINKGLGRGVSQWILATENDHRNPLLSAGVAVSSAGKLSAGLAPERLSVPTSDQVTAVLSTGDGAWVAEAWPVRLFKLDGAGRTERSLELPEVGRVNALALTPGGDLLMGTSPGGVLLKLSPGEERPRQALVIPARHILGLAVLSDREVYLASGSDGAVYRYDGGPIPLRVFDARAGHVVDMKLSGDRLLLGTAGPARAYSLDIRHDYAVQALASPAGDEARVLPSGEKDVLVLASPGGTVDLVSGGRSRRKTVLDPQAALTGAILWGDRLLAAAANGRLYELQPGGEGYRTLHAFTDGMPLAPGTAGDSLLIGTSGAGSLYRLKSSDKPRLESRVLDAGALADWGTISWRGKGASRLLTRSGDTPVPGSGWSDWSPEYETAAGGSIVSPASRYLQLGILPGADAELEEITVNYRVRNRPPELRVASPSPGQPLSGSREVKMMSGDADGDKVALNLYCRTGQAEWKLLAENLQAPVYKWDTVDCPDGRYDLKVTASDALANPEAPERTEVVVGGLMIDNTAPWAGFAATVLPDWDHGCLLEGVAEDKQTIVTGVDYRFDQGASRAAVAADLFDSGLEAFRISLEGLSAGEHALQATVYDAAGNSRTLQKKFYYDADKRRFEWKENAAGHEDKTKQGGAK